MACALGFLARFYATEALVVLPQGSGQGFERAQGDRGAFVRLQGNATVKTPYQRKIAPSQSEFRLRAYLLQRPNTPARD